MGLMGRPKIAGYLLLLLIAITAGRVFGKPALDKSKAASLTHVHVVAIEGPPLSGLDLSKARLPGAPLVAGGAMLQAGGLAIVGGVLMLMAIPEANAQSAAASQEIESLLDKTEIWEPTLELANEAMRQLSAANEYAVSVDERIMPLPGVKRKEATLFMENWMAPVRAWQAATLSPFVYSEEPRDGVVLEVGLLNYELSGSRFLVQVKMKVVDRTNGVTLARTRAYSYKKVDDLDRLFEDDAAGYKQMFRETTTPLVTRCLTKIGLLRP